MPPLTEERRREFRDVKVSPLLVLARAVMLAMRRTPEINSWWDDAAQEPAERCTDLAVVVDDEDARHQLTATASRISRTLPASASGANGF